MNTSLIKDKDGNKIKFFRSENYNYYFNLNSGMFYRWGKKLEDDPSFSPFGPEIFDCEISTICNKGCSYCYKSNTSNGKNMSFETFQNIINKVNINNQLTQVAFGLGASGEENPDLWKMCDWLRSINVIPNGTIADISYETADRIAKNFGAVAVSIHGDKSICYNMVKKLTSRGMKQVNIHHVIYEENYEDTLRIFEDIKEDERLSKLNAIVLLSLKKKGRAEKGDFTPLSQEKFNNLVNLALMKEINFGFDSCSAHKFMKAIENHPKQKEMIDYCEPCESGIFSMYANVDGKYFPCSFSEDLTEGYDIVSYENFIDEVWNKDSWRDRLLDNKRECLVYSI